MKGTCAFMRSPRSSQPLSLSDSQRCQEIDAVVELPDGRWCAFEIKLGANDAAAASLL